MRPGLRGLAGASSAIAVLALSGTAGAADCPPPQVSYSNNCTSYTSSPSCINFGGTSTSFSTRLEESASEETRPTQVVETYRTQVTGVDGEMTLYEETADEASDSAAIEELIAAASAAVDAAGGTATEPRVIESTRTLVSSDTDTSDPIITTSTTLEQREVMGPNPIDIGENECVAWVVASGWNHIDTLAITERVSTVTLTTTETYLTVVRIQIGIGDPPATTTTTTTAPTNVAPAAEPAAAVESAPAYTG
jgi:hypothetical protein